MSQYVRWEIDVVFRRLSEWMWKTRRETLTALLPYVPTDCGDTAYKTGSEVTFTFYGEDTMPAAPHDLRHAAIVRAVRDAFPRAAVRTRWLCMDNVDWDDVFDTGDER